MHSVRNVGNDNLNYVCYSWHVAHDRSRNFELKMMFGIVSMMHLTAVEISNMPKCAKQTAISKSFKTL